MENRYIRVIVRDIMHKPIYKLLVDREKLPEGKGLLWLDYKLTECLRSVDERVHVLEFDPPCID